MIVLRKIKLSATSLIITMLCAYAVAAANDDATYVNLVKLVSDFRNTYRSFNVFICRSEPAGDLRVSFTFVKLMKRFSQQNVFAMITRITDIPKDISYYDKRMDRPFFVIIIKSMWDFFTFSDVTRTNNMNLYQILMVFSRELDMCHHPVGNPFHLVFDSRLLVKCQEFPIMREWYSLHPNTTEVTDLLIWKPDVPGFMPLTNLSFYERRSTLRGQSLRITIMEDSKLQNNKLTGFFGKVLTEISEAADFKIDLQPFEEAPGSYDPNLKKWTGVMGKLYEKKTDIGVSEFSVTQERLDIIDFSDPIVISKSNFYLKKSRESHVLWSMYYKAFGVRASYCLFIVLLVSPILVTMTMSRRSSTRFSTNAYENYFNVWGIFCAKSPTDFPKQSSARIAFYSLYILSFMLYSIYSALLVSYLTIFKPDMPFNSLKEFTAARTHKITTIKNTSYIDSFKFSNDTSMRRLNSFLLDEKDLPSSLSTAIDQICGNKKQVVLYMDDIILRSNRFNIPCELIPFERGRLSSMGLAFVKNSPYVGLINFHLQRMRNFGLLDAIKLQNLKRPEPGRMTYKAVTMWSTLPLFGILYGGLLLSVIIMIFENIIFYILHQRRRLVNSRKHSIFMSKNKLQIMNS